MEKLVKPRHHKRYIKDADHREESGLAADRVTTGAVTQSEPIPVINYMWGSPSNNQYQLKHQRKKILRAATVKARVNAIHTEGNHEETKPIDGPISLPPINSNRIIVPHYDALVLTLCICGFDVHRVLVDPGNATNFL